MSCFEADAAIECAADAMPLRVITLLILPLRHYFVDSDAAIIAFHAAA